MVVLKSATLLNALLCSTYSTWWVRQCSAATSPYNVTQVQSTTTPASSSLISATITSSSPSTTLEASASALPSIDPSILKDINTISVRRLSSIVATLSSPSKISAWLSTLGTNGKWPDSEVDYTTGCDARRANWPAQDHWQRIIVMAGAWHGGLKGADQYVQNPQLRTSISSAMGYWFSRDFKNPACLGSGGTSQCPCSNTDNSLWNTNWFSNEILIPELVGQVCLLLNNTLSSYELDNCIHISVRSYAAFDHSISGVPVLTGANALDVAKVGINLGLLTTNVTLLTDAYRRVHSELQIQNGVMVDGIRADGAFAQHGGMLYNGNYGKDYANDVLDIEVEVGGTKFAADTDSRNAFGTLFEGDRWMIVRNALTGVLHWDLSALGRFISFPVIDNQATGSIKINVSEVAELGQQWSSTSLAGFADSLSLDDDTANAGGLCGNRMFYTSDYMVHRGLNYVSSVKMYSSRTQNTECTNSQNPMGFHLSDGVHYTYLQGDEYEDIAAVLDWNLIPGITVDYASTTLQCSTTQQSGVEAFVGGVSNGQTGVAAMRYTNPLNQALRFQKAWFFLEGDVQLVMIASINSTSRAPVYSVLDQKRHRGVVLVNDNEVKTTNTTAPQTLWHGDVGYVFQGVGNATELAVRVGNKTGAWSNIGTSTQPPATVDIFTAWLRHTSISTPISYTVFPGVSSEEFKAKRSKVQLRTIQNDRDISAVCDEDNQTTMIVFWGAQGGSVKLPPSSGLSSISVKGNVALIYRAATQEVTVSNPSQSLTSVQVTFTSTNGSSKAMTLNLPTGGTKGDSITQTI